MTRYLTPIALALAALAAPAFAATNLDANAEFDTGTQNLKSSGAKGSFQSGRVEANISGRVEGDGGFFASKGTVIIGRNGGASVDDAWVQLGTSSVDVKLGRFEAADLYATPADVVRIGGLYGTNLLRGRDDNRVHAACTFNLGTGVSLELGLVDVKDTSAAGSKGVRPVLSYGAGPLSLKVGLESGKTSAGGGTEEASFSGVGAALAYNLGSANVRANLANGKIKEAAGDKKRSALLLGVDVGGLSLSAESGKDEQAGVSTKYAGAFGGYSFQLFGVKNATVTPAFGTQSKDVGGTKTTDTKLAVRIHYDF